MNSLKFSIRKIAEQTQLSASTVWRASLDPSSVKPKTWEILQPYFTGYTTDSAIKDIAILVPDIRNPFFASVVQGAIAESQCRCLKNSLFLSDNILSKELDFFENLSNVESTGVIWIPSTHIHNDFKFLQTKKYAVSVVDRILPEFSVPVTVAIDNEQLAYRATTLLIQGGCSHLAMISSSIQVSTYSAREAGFLRALSHHKIKGKILRVEENSPETAYRLLVHYPFRQENINGILSATGYLKPGILQSLNEQKLEISKHIAFISFEADHPLYSSSSITDIIQPTQEMGAKAVELLLEYRKKKGNYTFYYCHAHFEIKGSEQLN